MYAACIWVLLSILLPVSARAWSQSDSQDLIRKLEAAYSKVDDYQTRLVITGFGKERAYQEIQRLRYAFKKPNRIRIEFQSPHEGMIIAYPDSDGKVSIRPRFWGRLITFRLDPKNSFLEISPGQQIDQTDLGLLIRNITHSLTDMFLGELDVTTDHKHVIVDVFSDNPFRRGIATRYVFFIDREMWLPVAVRESTAEKVLKRTVVYENLKLNTGLSDAFFRID